MSGDTMSSFIDLTGQVFGRLTVLRRSGTAASGHARWFCSCECGNTTQVLSSNLRVGVTKSCGCLVAENMRKVSTTHGLLKHSSYQVWAKMLGRCLNQNNPAYKHYGGRGITVCDRWLSVENFIADMGERPARLSLERVDVNKGYSKDNCVWADAKTQARNKRTNIVETFKGKTATLIEHSEDAGLNYSTVWFRRNKLGWSLEKALTTPVRDPVEYAITSKP